MYSHINDVKTIPPVDECVIQETAEEVGYGREKDNFVRTKMPIFAFLWSENSSLNRVREMFQTLGIFWLRLKSNGFLLIHWPRG